LSHTSFKTFNMKIKCIESNGQYFPCKSPTRLIYNM
jgi:hypothetical protein